MGTAKGLRGRLARGKTAAGIGLAGLVLAASFGATGASAEYPTSNVAVYTGCLTTGGTSGQISNVAPSATAPLKPCGSNQTVVHLSGGTVTGVTAGAGLSGGGSNGAVTLGLAPGYSLPQACGNSQIPVWNGSGWQCADQPAYSNGTGLNLNGNTFSVKPQYQLPQGCASGQLAGSDGAGGWGCQNDKSYTGSDFAVSNQGCPGGQFASAVDSAGKLSCAAPPTNAPIHGYFQDGGIQNGDYPTSVGGSGADLLSRQVPSSGFYMVFANASLGNVDGDSQPADCGIEVSNNGNTSTLADTWIDLNSKQVSGNLVTGTTLTAAASVAPVNYGGYLAQGSIVTLHCHSFNAYAMDQSLSLISVNAMN